MHVDVGGRRLFFDIVGEQFEPVGTTMRQRPTLIAIHGAPGVSDHSALRPELSPLADAMQLIYLDIAGAGRSDDPHKEEGFSLDLWADDIVRFCATLGIEKPVVLGNSGGGFIAQAYAIRHRDHARGVIFASTQARLDPERSIAKFAELGGPDAERAARGLLAQPTTAQAIAAYNSVCMPLYNRTRRHPDATHRMVQRPVLADAFHRYPDGIWHTFDLTDALHRIRVPVLVLAGDDDPITPLQDSRDIVARLDPSIVTFAHLPACGHGPWRDKPDETLDIIRTFVRKL